jgi:hypothetical protein
MDQDTRIANLEAEVAALHLFVVAALDGLKDLGNTSLEFHNGYETLRERLLEASLPKSAELLDDAVEAMNNRSTVHLIR